MALSPAVVVDASIVVKWLAHEPDSEPATRVIVDGGPLTAPDLLPVEVANVLWKKIRRGDMTTAELQPAITALLALGIGLYQSTPLLSAAAHLAVTTGHPVYDCLYLALATDTGVALATADRRLQQTAHDIGVSLWTGL
ncbi:MAG: PIN domain nuclease [Acidobacteria bacterium]|nr:MAG: PIN domain nuclease [Acidobacteriota bacterium]